MAHADNLPSFVIEGFEFISPVFVARFEIVDGDNRTRLSEIIDFGNVDRFRDPSAALLRLLTLACSLSYYKATTATNIEVGFAITASELTFYEQLVRGGLAEYAYRNDLPGKLEPFIRARVDKRLEGDRDADWALSARPLVAVGGGKDSVVSIESLKRAGKEPVLYSVNSYDPIVRCVEVSGCDYVQVSRQLDPVLQELNAQGALNGHVPVTAINSLVGLIVADIAGYGPVVMSNEKSASSGNLVWNGRDVNHQWSKSLEFEDLLRDTLTADGLDRNRYFSLLRHFREIDIAERFAQFPEYFEAFTSCNRVFLIDPSKRRSSWCGECPKCLFVFLVLAPFVDRDVLVATFGVDLMEDSVNISGYEEILGLSGHKPFECVGEYDEAQEALRSLAHNARWNSSIVVKALIPLLEPSATATVPIVSVDRVPEEFREARDSVTVH